jgi:hypothetical protein
MSNVTDFLALMTKFAVPVKNEIAIDSFTEYLNRPVSDQLFTGTDAKGRVFINLPITHVASDAVADTAKNFDNQGLVIFQRHAHNDTIFVKGGPVLLLQDKITGDTFDDLSNLEKLLNGETLRFHTTRWTPYGGSVEDPLQWVEITLKR